MLDKSIVYYTGNGDYPKLEEAVRDTITRHSDGMPIVSVSHQPLNFGTNICVGPLQQSPEHVFMQLRLGVQAATSKYVCVCEADTLYPPEFFQFQPQDNSTYYHPGNGYILWQGRKNYHQKHMRELTGVVARSHLLSLIEAIQKKHKEVGWPHRTGTAQTMRIDKIVAAGGKTLQAELGPVVTLKSGRGMHQRSPMSKHNYTRTLPTWGMARSIWQRYRCE
jgi:hypothetical protein